MFDLHNIKSKLQQQQLARHIHQYQNTLVLQEPSLEDGIPLNVFAQHEFSDDQVGLQFGLQMTENQLNMLVGLTYSNQNPLNEIGIHQLKGELRAFNLLYSFYNYPKALFLIEFPLCSSSSLISARLETVLLHTQQLSFIETALKINLVGEPVQWIKQFIFQQILSMKIRIQQALQA